MKNWVCVTDNKVIFADIKVKPHCIVSVEVSNDFNTQFNINRVLI